MHCLVGQKDANRNEYYHGQPHSDQGGGNSLLNEFFAKHVQQVEDQEKYDGHNKGHSQSPFANDRAKRGAYEE